MADKFTKPAACLNAKHRDEIIIYVSKKNIYGKTREIATLQN